MPEAASHIGNSPPEQLITDRRLAKSLPAGGEAAGLPAPHGGACPEERVQRSGRHVVFAPKMLAMFTKSDTSAQLQSAK